MRLFLASLVLVALVVPQDVVAQDKSFRLAAPESLIETGLLKHLLPRFSLKTGLSIDLVPPDAEAEARFLAGPDVAGKPVFQGPQTIWNFDYTPGPATDRFADWLRSDVGKRTVTGFAPEGVGLFVTEIAKKTVVAEVSFDGDAGLGKKLSLERCGRCHVVGPENRMNGLGSTPSFAVLRTLPNWSDRFQSFYALNPHPSFTQIADVTEPFDPERPSPIVPLQLSLPELEAILAFVAVITPADLGAPVASR